jgi:hypothetical protein
MYRTIPTLAVALLALGAGVAVAAGGGPDAARGTAQGGLPQGDEPVKLDPADFTTKIDNPYWPMVPGSRWIYREGEQRIVVTVLRETRMVAGVEARVVHDIVREKGQLVEDTFDWYAQDKRGNIWYLGENTKEYENGRVSSTAGSWEYGVDGAQAGIIMAAKPKAGLHYRQEYLKGEAEDEGEVVSTSEHAKVPAGFFRDLLMTRDTTQLEPRRVEYKFYAKGVGEVVALSPGGDNEELIRYRRGG